MKSILFAGLLFGVASAAHAAPYLNVEANQAYSGSTLGGTVLDIHYGVESNEGNFSWYAQGGPSVVSIPSEDTSELQFSGKVGGAVAVGAASIYGELSGVTTANDPAVGVKAGVKWGF
tara:strand:- start:158 stop:511 length:354 start_codon:yes stop_codon:yes gene_type:complete